MEVEQLARIVRSQKDFLRTAQAKAGHARTVVPDRLQLYWEFSLGSRPDTSVNHIRQTIVGEVYPPCRLQMDDLSQMLLKDLRLETHHRGKFLVLRAFGHPYKLSSVMNAFEDQTGDVDRVAIYNMGESLQPDEVLPRDCVIAIKEPYYKMSADGRCTLRVDHPCDLVVLERDHTSYPTAWKSGPADIEGHGLFWKLKGNTALAKKSYLEAHRCYTHGLKNVLVQEPALKRDLHRNRCLVDLILGRYEIAMEDALSSLSNSDDEQAKILDAKALYRCGRAAYQLENYSDALAQYERMLKLSPSDKDGLRELKRTKERLKEMRYGSYDFAAMLSKMRQSGHRADHASFISKTEVRQTPNRGRGLFSTQNISEGDLILCEKAVVAAHDRKDNASISLMVNLNSDRASMGTNVSVWIRAIQKVMNNPSLGPRLLNLYHVEQPSNDATVPVIDGNAVVDVFRVQQVVEYNAFGFAVGRESEAYGAGARMSDRTGSSGLWSRASFVNHACLSNAQRSFIGDMMILRATKAIPKNTEVTIAYLNVDPHLDVRQKKLLDGWRFKCTCYLCEREGAIKINRRVLIKASSDFMEANRLNEQSHPKSSDLRKAEQLATNLENSYTENLSQQIPCLALMSVCRWLCEAYYLLKNLERVKIHAVKCLRSQGYKIDVQGTKVRMDGTNGILVTEVVDALMRLSIAYANEQNTLARDFRRLAEKMYEIINGSMTGFEKRY